MMLNRPDWLTSDRLAIAMPVILFVASWLPGRTSWSDEPRADPVAAEGSSQAVSDSAASFFQQQVLPIFQRHCFECHSHASGKAQGGLMLDSASGWTKGGDSGAAVVAGEPDQSLLIQAVRYGDLEMPPRGKLPADSIAVLERWVRAGAVAPQNFMAATTTPSGQVDLEAARKHWSFQPLRGSSPPIVSDTTWPRDDADRFLLARLEERGLAPVRDTDPYTWLRRVHLDLTGLPPTEVEIRDFIAANRQEVRGVVDGFGNSACASVVDRLLKSRAFGERWGRHWLDLVGYADQIGTANDIFAEHAWRYRDYVIGAFQTDMPYAQFIREQLAGDLLPYDSAERRARQLVATGFLLLGDLTVVEADKAKLRVDVVDQQVDKIGRAFLGMTLGCARCHDHKFDPISQRDYYALAGILHSTESIQKAEWGVWSWPTLVDLPETERQQAERWAGVERHRQRLSQLMADRDQLRLRKQEVDAVLSAPGGGVPEGEAAKDAARGVLGKVQSDLAERLRNLDAEILHAEFFSPAPPKAFAVRDSAAPADMRITIRGNPHALGDTVPRGFLQVVSGADAEPIPTGASGRRELADWLTRPDNPLTARVAVNRIWQKLFGEGLVRSVDYFGMPVDPPLHPELLDHLAQRFVAGGWSQRKLIRALVLSRAYRMSSSPLSEHATRVDPDNRLFWRMPPRRLDAEAIRDSLLAVSGQLIDSPGGPSLPLEYRENTGNLGKGQVNPPSFRLSRFRPEQEFERSVYLPVIRSAPQAGPAELRNVFDFTQPAEFAGQRSVTAVPTQALFLMNSQLMKDRARDLARRILQGDAEAASRLERLWLRVFNRPIEPGERGDAMVFLKSLTPDHDSRPSPEDSLEAWTDLCHSLLASNEFLMRL